jgi:HSP20 family protein
LLIKGENIMTSTAIALHRPGLVGSSVFHDAFDNFFSDFPSLLRQTTQGYPVADIYRNDNGDTVLEFALAGFTKKDLSIDVKPEKRSLTVRAECPFEKDTTETSRRIARRSFEKTYVNFDDNLDLSAVSADFENGLLTLIVPTRPEAKPISIKIK